MRSLRQRVQDTHNSKCSCCLRTEGTRGSLEVDMAQDQRWAGVGRDPGLSKTPGRLSAYHDLWTSSNLGLTTTKNNGIFENDLLD